MSFMLTFRPEALKAQFVDHVRPLIALYPGGGEPTRVWYPTMRPHHADGTIWISNGSNGGQGIYVQAHPLAEIANLEMGFYMGYSMDFLTPKDRQLDMWRSLVAKNWDKAGRLGASQQLLSG